MSMSQPTSSSISSRVFIIVSLLLFVGLFVAVGSLRTANRVPAAQQQQGTTAQQRTATPSDDPLIIEAHPVGAPEVSPTDPVFGPADAPVTLIEFSDFDCPYCKDVEQTLHKIATAYGNNVRFVWKDFPLVELHPNTLPAHVAARCAFAQDAFFLYKDALYADQDTRALSDFLRFAEELRLDTEMFQQCLNRPDAPLAVIEDSLTEGMRHGVDSTPYFFVNNQEVIGAQDFATFQKIIDAELAR
ncbi:MAG: hypothetical protein COT39_03095 [Parcubacteria group bacterium CG08_land_8_20_14_0_20_48_21]|nr:MAG: hypothetical protein COT39_03095 [Parcubacteria group bacterium CG08_land_8_20_14_0_20_48_21]PIY78280.1 MAG: hypothetical protein COY83_00775 [Parcubacteria group bacterium CG_4_10_14_0_8_um_filter_48_154]PIZ77379.1 MAG: hypothetical protein COY03_03055 [bacterium CG_4_10_14_0_2_um_filter_48_144]PJC39634.1 MAG: hypothetical protein CO043_03130 [Parcubacteria group bacterium CG_4_9_14_0_2_um_filter_48_40]